MFLPLQDHDKINEKLEEKIEEYEYKCRTSSWLGVEG